MRRRRSCVLDLLLLFFLFFLGELLLDERVSGIEGIPHVVEVEDVLFVPVNDQEQSEDFLSLQGAPFFGFEVEFLIFGDHTGEHLAVFFALLDSLDFGLELVQEVDVLLALRGKSLLDLLAQFAARDDFVLFFQEGSGVVFEEVVANSILELLIQVVSRFLFHDGGDVEHVILNAIFNVLTEFHFC